MSVCVIFSCGVVGGDPSRDLGLVDSIDFILVSFGIIFYLDSIWVQFRIIFSLVILSLLMDSSTPIIFAYVFPINDKTGYDTLFYNLCDLCS